MGQRMSIHKNLYCFNNNYFFVKNYFKQYVLIFFVNSQTKFCPMRYRYKDFHVTQNLLTYLWDMSKHVIGKKKRNGHTALK